MSIVVSGGLKPSTADTPLDLRTRCDALADIANIENPFVGMVVYCKATGKLYRVKTLTETKVGVITTYRIGEYEALPDLTDISGLSGRLAALEAARNDPAEIIIDIAGLTADNRASLIIELCEDAGFAGDDVTVYDSATEDGNGAFLVYGGLALGSYPTAGINSVYNGGQVIFTLPAGNTCEYYRWYWRSESGDTQGSTTSMRYGRLHSVRQSADFAELGFS